MQFAAIARWFWNAESMCATSLFPRQAGPLELRLPDSEEIEQLLQWRNHPDVWRWLIHTKVDPDEFRKQWLDGRDDPKKHSSIAVLDGEVIGIADVWISDGMGQMHVDDGAWRNDEAGIGYLIDPAHTGKGYATEIARALLEIAFEDLGVRRVTAGCFADNIASWKIMEKVGMRREQHGVQDSWHAELGWIDGFTYGILADEWRASRG